MIRSVQVVLGLGFGDEGKGTMVDWLARRAVADGRAAPLVVRWNGGPQAQHHVVTDDGRVHCFAQLGSASFLSGARTHLAGDMAVDHYALAEEIAELAVTSGRSVDDLRASVTIDPRCALVTPWHAAVNVVREALRGGGRHGSTGRGVGEAKLGPIRIFAGELGFDVERRVREVRTALLDRATRIIDELHARAELDPATGDPATNRTGHLDHAANRTGRLDPATNRTGHLDHARTLLARAAEPDLLDAYLAALRQRLAMTDALPDSDHVIFESAQGALLDRDHGFFPHVTPSRITRRAARDVARSLGIAAPLEVWGVLRAYHSRHGEGPFPSEDRALATRLPERHNREDGQAGRFRVGWFDAVLARHAIAFAGPIDRLAVTCLDRIATIPDRAVVTGWRDAAEDIEVAVTTAEPIVRPVDDVAVAIAELLGRRIDVASYGPAACDKRSAYEDARSTIGR